MSATSGCQEGRAGSSGELFKGKSRIFKQHGIKCETQHSYFAANVALPPPPGDSQRFWFISQRPKGTQLYTRIKRGEGSSFNLLQQEKTQSKKTQPLKGVEWGRFLRGFMFVLNDVRRD